LAEIGLHQFAGHNSVYAPSGEAKFWIEPSIELAVSKGFNSRELKEIETQIKEPVDWEQAKAKLRKEFE